MIFILIGLLILVYALRDFKHAFLMFLVFKLFLTPNINLLSLPGFPFVTLDLFMTFGFATLFLLNKNKLRIDRSPFPFKYPFICLTIAWFVSSIFAYVGFMSAFVRCVSDIMFQCVVVWMIWCLITEKKDVIFLLRLFTIAFLVTCLYGLYEYSIQSNPLMDYERSLVSDASRAVGRGYDAGVGRGYRVQSVFEHAIGAGLNWGMYFFLALIMIIKYNWRMNISKVALLTSILCVPCVIFSNSRSSLVFLAIGSLSFVNFKNGRFNRFLIAAIIVAVFALPYFSQYLDNFFSLFDADAQERVGGSDFEMRLNQLKAVLAIWSQSPIWGMGAKFMMEMKGVTVDALLGLESIWFVTLTQYGLIGLYAYAILCYYTLIKIPLKYKSNTLFFISLAYWFVSSATTTPGVMIYFYFMILIIEMKLIRNQLR